MYVKTFDNGILKLNYHFEEYTDIYTGEKLIIVNKDMDDEVSIKVDRELFYVEEDGNTYYDDELLHEILQEIIYHKK